MRWRDALTRTLEAVPDDELPAAMGELEAAKVRLLARLLGNGQRPEIDRNTATADRWLTVAEVADEYGMSRSFVYGHKDELGARHLGRALRFPERAIRRYLARNP